MLSVNFINCLRLRIIKSVICVLFVSTPLSAQDFEWPRATPESVNISMESLNLTDERIRQGRYGEVRSFLVLRHGKLVYERYYNGFTSVDLNPLYSATKSIASGLIGMAVYDGSLGGIDTRLVDVFTDHAEIFSVSAGKQEMTIEHLMTMRHGLEWDEWSTFFTDPVNPVFQMTESEDWWQYVLNRPMTAPVDTVFRYSTGASNLLGGIISRTTGMSAAEYAVEVLQPLDIQDYYIEVDLRGLPRGTGITRFQDDFTPTGHGLWFRPTDMAKFGQLFLDDGVWQNHRLFDPDWTDISWGKYSDHLTDPQVFPAGLSYGYQWWTQRYSTVNGDVEAHLAWGYADQYIFVIPELDAVIVSTAGNFDEQGIDMRSALAEGLLDGFNQDFDPVADAGFSGSWLVPGVIGQGLVVEVVPTTGQIAVSWYTFDPHTNAPVWMVATSELHGRRALLQLRQPSSGVFNEPVQSTVNAWGDAELIFIDCRHAELRFISPLDEVEGSMPLRRITPPANCDAE